ncbi:MAG: fibronectin type III domain-containing protein, partial [Anaerolineales bacterium]
MAVPVRRHLISLLLLSVFALLVLLVRVTPAWVIWVEDWSNWAANWTLVSGTVSSGAGYLNNTQYGQDALLKYNPAIASNHAVRLSVNCGVTQFASYTARVRYDAATGYSYYATFTNTTPSAVYLYAYTGVTYLLGSGSATACGDNRLQIKANNSTISVEINGATLLSATDTYLTGGGVAVSLRDAVSQGTVTEAQISGIDSTPPTAPTNMAASPYSYTQVNLGWTASTDSGGSGLSHYQVYRDNVLLGTAPTTTYSDLTAQPDSTYVYRVHAVDGDGNVSAASNNSTATTGSWSTSRPDGLGITGLSS